MIRCIECKRQPQLRDTEPDVDVMAQLQGEFGWLQLRYGRAMRLAFCSTTCLCVFTQGMGLMRKVHGQKEDL